MIGLGVCIFAFMAAVGYLFGTYLQIGMTNFLVALPSLTLLFLFFLSFTPFPQTPPQLLPLSMWSSQGGPFPVTQVDWENYSVVVVRSLSFEARHTQISHFLAL